MNIIKGDSFSEVWLGAPPGPDEDHPASPSAWPDFERRILGRSSGISWVVFLRSPAFFLPNMHCEIWKTWERGPGKQGK